ncbi:hypothetical protein HPP92_019187 [Vanilla planifolia]|uniref:Uncharacterized protein n=1 Tax=Vanilla planifolia TaxID=51239 RepID=A0A835PZW0_VANPL|nr:hypothetical protein HPP92_019695 [Vanilla planifolia]KAG0465023.1 hypothetical protein HPP92_019187 [Vanilla planifolia]
MAIFILELMLEIGHMESGYVGDAVYCVIIAWLSFICWTIFNSCVDEQSTSDRLRRRRRAPPHIGSPEAAASPAVVETVCKVNSF